MPTPAQQRIGQQAPREHAFGDESKPRARTADVFKPHLISDGFAELARPVPKPRGAPPCEPPDASAPAQGFLRGHRQQRGRNARGLPRPRRRFDHQIFFRDGVPQRSRGSSASIGSFISTTARMVSGAFPSKRLLTKM